MLKKEGPAKNRKVRAASSKRRAESDPPPPTLLFLVEPIFGRQGRYSSGHISGHISGALPHFILKNPGKA
jgi:hypothetical protein